MKKVIKIVTFYDDGTFTESTPSLSPPPPTWQPVPNPYPWPYYPSPYIVTCKMEDGTTREIKLDSPIVAQSTS
jgi:hypothetical protein